MHYMHLIKFVWIEVVEIRDHSMDSKEKLHTTKKVQNCESYH